MARQAKTVRTVGRKNEVSDAEVRDLASNGNETNSLKGSIPPITQCGHIVFSQAAVESSPAHP